MRWRGLPGKRSAPKRDGITATARKGEGGEDSEVRTSDNDLSHTMSSNTRFGTRLFLALLAALIVTHVSWRLWLLANDELHGAYWIGFAKTARAGWPAGAAFVRKVNVTAETADLVVSLRADRDYVLFWDGVALGEVKGEPGAPSLDLWRIPGPVKAGEHQLLVHVIHPEGVASLRLQLEGRGLEKGRVVTDAAWRVDDDATRIRDGGEGLARYPATLWARPSLSSWGFSSSKRSWRGNAGASNTAVSSRIAARALTQ